MEFFGLAGGGGGGAGPGGGGAGGGVHISPFYLLYFAHPCLMYTDTVISLPIELNFRNLNIPKITENAIISNSAFCRSVC